MFATHYKFILLDKVAFMRPEYLYFAIASFCFIALVLVFAMLMVVLGKKNFEHKESRIASQLEEWVMDVILENTHNSNHVFAIPGHLKLLLKQNVVKGVLLNELMKLKKNLSGIAGNNMEIIYTQLNLQEISLKRIQSKLWHVKARGVQELAIMNQHTHHERIFELTHDNDNMVRMEAQISVVRLQGYNGLQFFENLSYPLSEWHQLNLLSLLGKQSISGVNGILNWLHSSNASVVQFTLKLFGQQHAIEFHDEVVKCLNHPNEVVRREAILCLGQMPSNEAAEQLHTRFNIESDKNIRLCIINEFIKTGSEHDLPFLQTLQHAEDVDIKLAANKTVLYLQKIF